MGNEKSKMQAAAPADPPVSNPKVSHALEGSQKVRGTVDRLTKRQEFLEKKMKLELVEAKKKRDAGNKTGALQHIKKKKMMEKEVERIHNYIISLEGQAMAIEQSQMQVGVIEAMKAGAEAQKKINKQMDVEGVEDLTADIQDLMDDAEQVSSRLAEPMMGGLDETDLDAEFAALGEEGDKEGEAEEDVDDFAMELPAAPTGAPVELPSAPKHTPKMKDSDEEALRALEAEMGM